MGMANSNGLEQFLEQRYGLDSTSVNEFIKGLNEGVSAGDDKKKAAYYAGIQIGQQVSNQMIKGINQELFGEDSTKTISLKNFMAGFISGYTGKGAVMTQDNALMIAQTKMEAIKAKNLEAQFAENKAAGERFLASNKNAEGVITLPSGLQYKVLTQGTGAVPADTSKVSVHYEGTLLDGTVFDSSYERKQPATFMANQVIKGWTEILQIMPVGSTYEVYIPQQLAYGAQNTGKIKPFSCLKFKIELLGIEK
jgi:FKBP-type peptidyl-prolyl cis-trans isomerase FklB